MFGQILINGSSRELTSTHSLSLTASFKRNDEEEKKNQYIFGFYGFEILILAPKM